VEGGGGMEKQTAEESVGGGCRQPRGRGKNNSKNKIKLSVRKTNSFRFPDGKHTQFPEYKAQTYSL